MKPYYLKINTKEELEKVFDIINCKRVQQDITNFIDYDLHLVLLDPILISYDTIFKLLKQYNLVADYDNLGINSKVLHNFIVLNELK